MFKIIFNSLNNFTNIQYIIFFFKIVYQAFMIHVYISNSKIMLNFAKNATTNTSYQKIR